MKRLFLVGTLLVAGTWFLWGQRGRFVEPPPFEVKQVFPTEVAPGRYQQVDPKELQQLAEDGWELVSVTSWVLLNEEHGDGIQKPIVTQGYPAYFFKRPKMATGR